MTYGIYSIQDKLNGFINVTVDANDNTAKRNFAHAFAITDSMFATNPEDYALYKVGSFDSDTGVVTPEIPISLIAHGTDFGKE